MNGHGHQAGVRQGGGTPSRRWGAALLAIAVVSAATMLLGSQPAAATGSSGDRYIVRLAAPSNAASLAAERTDATAAVTAAGGTVGAELTTVLQGYVVTLPSDQAATELLADPSVLSVTRDQRVTIDQTQVTPPSWGLDRIDQVGLPLSSSYSYANTGSGVRAYIIDTGINPSHVDFGGRVVAGTNFVADANGTSDCSGHGTHVAGTVGSATYGVAKGVTLVPVRTLDCAGSGWWSDVVLGLDWVANDLTAQPAGTRGVVNMSISGVVNASLSAAVATTVGLGIPVVVAAGNKSLDACNYSPGSTPTAITVGATQSNDARASYSNFGTCLDLFAPGSDIVSLSNTDNTGSVVMSGTSMATPHVTGAVAQFLQEYPTYTPTQIDAAVKSLASPNVVAVPGTGSPNLLLRALYTAPGAPTSVSAVAGNALADLTWTAPANDGGSAITGYAVYSTTDDGANYTVVSADTASTGTALQVTGLANATAYRFAVAAKTVLGTSARSLLSSAVTPTDPALVPVDDTASVTAGSSILVDVLANDPSGAVLGGVVASPSTGTAVVESGRIRYTSPAGSPTALVTFTYRLTGSATTATVTVSVTAASSGGGGGGGAAPAPAPGTGSGGGGAGPSAEVLEMRPAFGPTSGGTRALILGYGFWGAKAVTIGGVPVAQFRYIDAATLEIVTPPGAGGWQDVNVTLAVGKATATFRYVDDEGPAVGTPQAAPSAKASLELTPLLTGAGRSVAAGRSPARAPRVPVTLETAYTVVLRGLPRGQRAVLQAYVDGAWVPLGIARTSALGRLTVPTFTVHRAGTYLVKVVTRSGARYVKVVAG